MTAARDRLFELLTDRAVGALGAREQIELAELLVRFQDVDITTFDRAASAIAMASVAGSLEPMPAALATRVEERAYAAMAMAMASGGSTHPAAMPDATRTYAMPSAPPRPRVAPFAIVSQQVKRGPSRAFAIAGWIA